MGKQWLKVFGFFSILMAILLSSVVFGGYSSLNRSEGRIEITKELLFKACQNRLEILPQFLDYLHESEQKEMFVKLKQTGNEAEVVLHHAVSQKSPLDNALTLKLETSQVFLTKELAKIFLKLDKSQSKHNTEFSKGIKQQFFSAQNELAVAKKKYNTEVRYFNRRTKIFPGFLIAKLFGFNKSKYFGLSKDSFLGAGRTFGGKA